ncbi:MAG: ribonuclease HII [Parcubacteria group bacterium GW2011_GWA2_36_10]|nr:MAG: ribonuclease HII [Parcubacteria group bacterium GW2011_GWA2_36_10]
MNDNYIIGIDEVGRGCLAGPIVAVAVLLKSTPEENELLTEVKDSKKLSAKKREEIFVNLQDKFIWAQAEIDNQEIDKIGIQLANCLVVNQALENLLKKINNFSGRVVADHVGGFNNYVDNTLPTGRQEKIEFFTKGETKFLSIALASILAKVYRDRLMTRQEDVYPEYNFAKHKGYGSVEHIKAILKHGTSSLHRQSFLKNIFSPRYKAGK